MINKTKGKVIGYRFGGTEESYVVPITESTNIVEANKQREYIRTHPDATHQAKCMGFKILLNGFEPMF